MKKLNAKQLKILAIITMLIDHTAVALYGIVDFINKKKGRTNCYLPSKKVG